MRFKNRYVKVELTGSQYRLLRNCLLSWRNELIAEGIPTDDVDGILMKIMKK